MSSVFDKKPTCSIQVGFSYSFCVLSILSCIKEVYKGVFLGVKLFLIIGEGCIFIAF